MGVTMTDGPHYYNGAKFTVRMKVMMRSRLKRLQTH